MRRHSFVISSLFFNLKCSNFWWTLLWWTFSNMHYGIIVKGKTAKVKACQEGGESVFWKYLKIQIILQSLNIVAKNIIFLQFFTWIMWSTAFITCRYTRCRLHIYGDINVYAKNFDRLRQVAACNAEYLWSGLCVMIKCGHCWVSRDITVADLSENSVAFQS